MTARASFRIGAIHKGQELFCQSRPPCQLGDLKASNSRSLRSRVLVVFGSLSMIIGAIGPRGTAIIRLGQRVLEVPSPLHQTNGISRKCVCRQYSA